MGNLILTTSCDFYEDDVTVFINTKYGVIRIEIVPNEQYAVIVLLWAKRLNTNQIHSAMHPMYGDKCFTKSIVQIWCKKMLGGQKFTSDTEMQSVVRQLLGQQPAASGIQFSVLRD